jgi:hypothetical protein
VNGLCLINALNRKMSLECWLRIYSIVPSRLIAKFGGGGGVERARGRGRGWGRISWTKGGRRDEGGGGTESP